MDDTKFGTRDSKGNWAPLKRAAFPPVFVWPVQPVKFVKWLFGFPGYILPWNLLYFAIAVAIWLWLTPAREVMQTLSPGWIALIGLRNAGLVIGFFGLMHLHLFMRRAQGQAFKYNTQWPEKGGRGAGAFLFKSQVRDNVFWTLASGVPIWTAWEAGMLWAWANGWLPGLSFEASPILFIALALVIPAWRDLHFYCVHRLLHWPPLYKRFHKLHHLNTNPNPWSGLAMHPVEHLLYFSCVALHIVVASHPVHILFNFVHAGLAPAPGHAGFDKILAGEKGAVDTHAYTHYLHHKYFECNYADGVVPLDEWFGTFHDGSPEAHERLKQRRIAS